tara:strand:- start:936 stop:1949 length:1014 start_codon:yes stop_codon:yes gene_type:complete
MENILITGGCGYLGAHCAIKLIEKGHRVIIVDNLSNSCRSVIDKISFITQSNVIFYKADIRDKELINEIFSENKIESIFHFSGLKSISESMLDPIKYYSTNVEGTINLVRAMEQHNVNKIIFSSSATVYGDNYELPWHEGLFPLSPTNPYANTKLIIEKFLKNLSESNNFFKIGILRYFNPAGSHASGLIGENLNNKNNLFPSILRVVKGLDKYLNIYGDNYDTKDGSGIRDYIHVSDLIEGHVKAFDYICNNNGYHLWNLGMGKGFSVFEILKIFEEKIGKRIITKIKPRRQGDLGQFWSDTVKAKKELQWKPEMNINNMVEDSINYLIKSSNYEN